MGHPGWPKEDIDKARKMWGNGLLVGEIAEALGRNVSAVKTYARAHPSVFPARADLARADRWTEYETTRARELWMDGKTPAGIARILKRTRNSVISKINRNPDLFPASRVAAAPVTYRRTVMTPETVSRAAQFWRIGLRPKVICERLGLASSTLKHIRCENPDLFPDRDGKEMADNSESSDGAEVTDFDRQRICALKKRGWSPNGIAGILRKPYATVNAVLDGGSI